MTPSFKPHTQSTRRLVAKQTQCETRPNGRTKKQPNTVGRFWFDRSSKRKFFATALLYIFEDNEAVIKMIIKGRMRHVSRTRRVALDWLFHRINLKIQIAYVHTRNQLADILTKGTFTRDQWHHLLRLFTIYEQFSVSRSHFSNRLDESLVMSKRQVQERQHGRGRCSRGCKIATHAKPGRFYSQAVLSVVEFKFHSAKPEEYRSKLLKFGP